MTDEVEELRVIEENRAKAAIIGTNPQLYMKLWPETPEDESIEWQTPETEEELADIVKMFESGTVYDEV